MPGVNIEREIASIRNQPGGNWLALALSKLSTALNMLALRQMPTPTPPPPPTGGNGGNGGNGANQPPPGLILGNNGKPVVDLADAAHVNRSLAALAGNLNDVPDSATRFAAVEASADHTANHAIAAVAVGQTADPALPTGATFTQIDGMSLAVDVVTGPVTVLIQFAGVVGAYGGAGGYSIQLWVDGASVAEFDPAAAPPLGVSQVFSFAVSLAAGSHTIQAMCANAPAGSTWKGVLRTLAATGLK